MSLRHEGVHAEQQSAPKDRHGVVETLTEAGRSNCHRAVGKAPDHDGVDHTHTHPANLGKDQGQRQTQSWAKFSAKNVSIGDLKIERHRGDLNLDSDSRRMTVDSRKRSSSLQEMKLKSLHILSREDFASKNIITGAAKSTGTGILANRDRLARG